MYLIYCLLITIVITSPATCETTSATQNSLLLGLINNIAEGFSNFATILNSFKDVFSILVYDKSEQSLPATMPEDALLNISQLTNKYGYDFEEHEVRTEDGYILKLHRISLGNVTRNGLVVFLMHGLIDCSDSWVIQGPNKSLAYLLSDAGFDVWMGNARGNKYSPSHETLDPKQSEFWKFTWDEIGVYDLPAMIDFTLNFTETESLYYVGHSQGTTSFYVMNSLKPEYNKKIKVMFSLAPVAWMTHAKSPIVRMFSPANKILGYLLSTFNTYVSSTEFFNKLASIICAVVTNKCDNLLYFVVGNNYKFINESIVPVIFGHMPCGSSTMQFMHYRQLVQSGRFSRYNYGTEGNKRIYGDVEAPDYNLSLVTAPVVLYYSGNDWLSDPADVMVLKNNLPNVYDIVYVKDFNHLDYLFADTAAELIYWRIIKGIIRFENLNLTKVIQI